ncbi:MAG TPA: hypothetical protein PK385_11365 [Spirochaetota bacterium]|nr:hypothetical protein [Spirochaetota bacterium]HOS33486.1 hypothetical protein [Spirochaetota bacterium]HOS56640.1 hypothetical protein [Spirochaetota bacterium]HPK61326.1 hypothetical protein [Spirochaetota bacterium]HQF78958.1 hypothetical protein [Spirochaetota bacterium]
MKIYDTFVGTIENLKILISDKIAFLSDITIPIVFIILYNFSGFIESLKSEIISKVSYFITNFSNVSISLVNFFQTNKILLSTAIIVVLVSIAVLTVISYLINFFKHGINYFKKIKLFADDVKKRLKVLIKPQFYKELKRKFEKKISFFVVKFLDYFWDHFRKFEIIGDPHKFNSTLNKKIDDFTKRFVLLSKIRTFIKRRFQLLNETLLLKDLTKKQEEHTTERQKLLFIESLPEAFSVFKNVSFTENPFLPQPWIDEIDKHLSAKSKGSLVISGHSGIGKTSLLRYIEKKYPQTSYYDLTDPLKREEFISQIDNFEVNVDKSKIIALDGLERLFKRKNGGFDLIRKTFSLIGSRPDNIFWVVSENKLFYDFINKIIPSEGIFTSSFSFPNFNSDFLYKYFDNKIASIGYNYKVIPDKKTIADVRKKINRKIISENEILNYLKSIYFQKIYNFGKENIFYHNEIFLKSIKRVVDKTIFIEIPPTSQNKDITNIRQSYVFILFTIALHGALKFEDISEILLIPPKTAEYQLLFLENKNLIVKKDEYYSLNSYNYPGVVKMFQDRNLLSR